MPNFLSDIPPDERLPFILIVCAIIFVAAGLMYFRLRFDVWLLKIMAKHGQEAMSFQHSEGSYNKNVWRTKKTWTKAAIISSLVGCGFLLMWYFTRSVTALLYGLSFGMCGAVGFSHASMSESQLQAYLFRKKNQSILVTRIFILGSITAYGLWFLLPREYFANIVPLSIFAYITLAIVIAGSIDHFYTRMRLAQNGPSV